MKCPHLCVLSRRITFRRIDLVLPANSLTQLSVSSMAQGNAPWMCWASNNTDRQPDHADISQVINELGNPIGTLPVRCVCPYQPGFLGSLSINLVLREQDFPHNLSTSNPRNLAKLTMRTFFYLLALMPWTLNYALASSGTEQVNLPGAGKVAATGNSTSSTSAALAGKVTCPEFGYCTSDLQCGGCRCITEIGVCVRD
ncbi:hypothetical protein SISSUDRAFT_634626 [Sistotremastrum suecicum HHB10207 ss-3]|uniref:Uncharacterized protein n=1 Tax=Sistotremastrum suecicum HHB10207 ss-3 TaxID=1314776 RepID=A0A166EDW0_9AGAM|nr:hypothetical protein SISSUDRAFT_634626 [Sistotremastrum suecicum HHB10207 ss-3]